MAAKVNSSYLSTQVMDLGPRLFLPFTNFFPTFSIPRADYLLPRNTEMFVFKKAQTLTHIGSIYLQNIEVSSVKDILNDFSLAVEEQQKQT